jgi:hydroxymethylbilane synthase
VKQTIVLGSRGSDLALIQTRMVEAALRSNWPEWKIETRIITTRGDEAGGAGFESLKGGQPDRAGRKGLFTFEIERALIAGRIDVAVHSAKDLPSAINPATDIAAALPRAAVEDILVSVSGYDLQSMPQGGLVATGSVRRRHQLQWQRADLQIIDLRGNVPTRLRKLKTEAWHGAVLARAGLERLGFRPNGQPMEFEGAQLGMSILPADVFVPAGGQGIIALQLRAGDETTRSLAEPINDPETCVCLRAERAFLRLLGADCDQPVGVYAMVNGHVIRMRGQVFEPRATIPRHAAVEGKLEDAEPVAAELLRRINGH